jgi:hypothetical protein
MNLAEVLSGRSGPEGVRRVLRGPPYRAVLRRELLNLLLDGVRLGPCRLRRAKFKPGRKLTAYFDVEVGPGSADRRSRPIAVTWTLPRAGKADGGPEAEAMEAEARRTGLAAPFRALEADVPEAWMRIMVSPLDPLFPQLTRMADPDRVHNMLAGLATRPQRRPPTAYRVSSVRYRPGQRHVLRYDPVSNDTGHHPGDGTLFAKLYRDGDSRGAFKLARAIAAWLDESESPVVASSPLSLVPDGDSVLYERVPGVPLSELISRGRGDVSAHLHRAGAALRGLQGWAGPAGTRFATHRLETEPATIARTSEHIRAMLPAAGSTIEGVLNRAEALSGRLPVEAPAFAHGDFKCDHLFLGPGGRLTLIDFNSCAMADPALDVGKFLADLGWCHAVSGRGDARASKRAFLEGYGPMDGHRALRAGLYEVLILTKITAHRVPIFSRAWSERTTRLLDMAAGLLDELELRVPRAAALSPR